MHALVAVMLLAAAQAQGEKDENDTSSIFHWDDGLHFTGPGARLKIKFGGAGEIDTTGFSRDEPLDTALGDLEGGVQWRRARLYAEGLFKERFEFKFQYDFASGNPPNLKDAYVGLRGLNLPFLPLDIRVGRFRAPLSLEGYTGANNTTFIERGLITAFLPSRNSGIMFHGDSLRHLIRWNVAWVQEEDDFGVEISSNSSLTARFAAAFRPNDDLIHVGADYTRRNAEKDGTLRFLERPEAHLAPQFVDTGDFPAEKFQQGMVEAAFVRGPFSLQGEFVQTFMDAPEVGNPRFHGFYVFASYFFTGESRPYSVDRGSFGRPHPKTEYRDSPGALGAFELAFRWSRLDLTDKDVDGGELTDFTVGLNWYATHATRIMFNGIVATRKGVKPVGIFQVRLQVAF